MRSLRMYAPGDCLRQAREPTVAAYPGVLNAAPTEEKQANRCNRQRRFASDAALTGCVFRAAGQIGMLRAYSLPVRPAVPFDRIEDRHGISCKMKNEVALQSLQNRPTRPAETNANPQQIPIT